MIRLLHGIEGIPLCTCGPQNLLRCKAHLLLVGHIEQQKLLPQDAKPVLCIQGLICRREGGRVHRDVNGEFSIGGYRPIPVPAGANFPRPRPREGSRGALLPHPRPRSGI